MGSTGRIFTRKKNKNGTWSPWSSVITDSQIGDAKPKVLMFDEATSALDNMTQKIVSDSLDTLNCTRIVIAHRLSTIKNCDRIIVLDNGKIIEDGTYDELILKNGIFTELVKRQRLESEEDEIC